MLRFLPRLWAGTGLLAALLLCSCQHNRCCCCKCQTPCAAPKASPLACSCRPAPTVAAPVQANMTKQPEVAPSAPVVHTTAKQNPTDLEKSSDALPSLDGSNQDVQIPVPERFGHDTKYRWLVGTLDYSRIQRAWLLRYVPFEEDDRYGGCVTLVGDVPTKSLKPGATVRVEGNLIDPDSRQLRPAFQVQNLRATGL
ncbi:MAG TPA: hypothetical protein VH592_21730 [Gemmataceae bacterium]